MSSEIKIGDEYFGPRNNTVTVVKIHKTGRVVVSDSDLQWTPEDNGDLSRRNPSNMRFAPSRIYLRRITPERIAERERASEVVRAKNAIWDEGQRLVSLSRSNDDDAILAEAARIAAIGGDHAE